MKLVFGGGESVADSVTFKWPGLGGAEAQVAVSPDQSKIDLDALDYSKTRVRLVTNYGDITLSFFPDKAPNHVRNFVKLAKQGFYDGTQFHRVIKGFMVQGGCPNTKEGATGRPGTGNPGYTIDAEFNDTPHERGIVSMARSTDPNSAGSQFFIVHQKASHLDNQYTAFGKVDKGMKVVDAIADVPCGGPQRSTPLEPVRLNAAVVFPVYK
ncbi:MAG: peptidylprolyl isomerase [Planctomycetes bacterium]|nr:peptidylprolyl isomerase [Planctomycetota bacterium]